MADIASAINSLGEQTAQTNMTMAQRAAPGQYGNDFTNYTDSLRNAAAFQQSAMPVIAATAGIFQNGQKIQQAEQELQLRSMAERTRQEMWGQQVQDHALQLGDVQKLNTFQSQASLVPTSDPDYLNKIQGLYGNAGVNTLQGQQAGIGMVENFTNQAYGQQFKSATLDINRTLADTKLLELKNKNDNQKSIQKVLDAATAANIPWASSAFSTLGPDGNIIPNVPAIQTELQRKDTAARGTIDKTKLIQTGVDKAGNPVYAQPNAATADKITVPGELNKVDTALINRLQTNKSNFLNDLKNPDISEELRTQYQKEIDNADAAINQILEHRGAATQATANPDQGNYQVANQAAKDLKAFNKGYFRGIRQVPPSVTKFSDSLDNTTPDANGNTEQDRFNSMTTDQQETFVKQKAQDLGQKVKAPKTKVKGVELLPAGAPETPTTTGDLSREDAKNQLVARAQDAIKHGKDPTAVSKILGEELQKLGFDTSTSDQTSTQGQ